MRRCYESSNSVLNRTETKSFELQREYGRLVKALTLGPEKSSHFDLGDLTHRGELLQGELEGEKLRESTLSQEVDVLKSTVENIRNLLYVCPEQPRATLNAICSVIFKNDTASPRSPLETVQVPTLSVEEEAQLSRLDTLIDRMSQALGSSHTKPESEETESSLRSLHPDVLSATRRSSEGPTPTSDQPRQTFTLFEKAFTHSPGKRGVTAILR